MVSFFFWAKDPLNVGMKQGRVTDFSIKNEGEIQTLPAHVDSLKIMTWNIAYARGTDPNNDKNDRASKEVFFQRLKEMAEFIKKEKVDILFLQEIDFDSKRSHHLDELKILAEISGLRFGAKATSWRSRWIPHPPWPLHKQFGPMLSGGAVLSRYRIMKNDIYLHEKPKANGALYNAFYLFRYSQFLTIHVGHEDILVVNNHLEAFDRHNRMEQAKKLRALIKDYPHQKLVIGGDFNSVPSGAKKKFGFIDCKKDDYRNDQTLEILSTIRDVKELVNNDDYLKNERLFFTFPTLEPTRRLDYLFYRGIKLDSYRIHRINKYSDHCPVSAIFQLDSK